MNMGSRIGIASSGKGVVYWGGSGGMWHTTDFARSWSRARGAKPTGVREISIHASGFGLAACAEGIAVTRNSGRSWRVAVPGVQPLSVAVGGGRVGLAACAGGMLYRTANAGTSWRRVAVQPEGEPIGIRFVGDTRCHLLLTETRRDAALTERIRLAAYFLWQDSGRTAPAEENWYRAERSLARRSVLLRSDDAGLTWVDDGAPEGIDLIDLDARGQTVVALAGDGRVVSRKTPRSRWKATAVPIPGPGGEFMITGDLPWAVRMVSPAVWLCLIDYVLARTRDGGARWSLVSAGLNRISSVQFIDEKRGFATSADYGGDFTVAESRDGGARWSYLSGPRSKAKRATRESAHPPASRSA